MSARRSLAEGRDISLVERLRTIANQDRPVARRQSACQNRLLSLMSAEDFALLADVLEPVDLPLHARLATADQPIPYVYFLEEGVASFIAETPRGLRVEAGMIGREGFTVPALALDTDRIPHGIRMQVAGYGHRVPHARFRDAFGRSPSLLKLTLRFAQVMLVQTSYTALSNAVHEVEQRLARWLLMTHDRSCSDDLALTHNCMSIMLGVRRPSITAAMHLLEGEKLIQADRGCVTIRNRAALEALAGDSYGKPEAEYRRLIGPF